MPKVGTVALFRGVFMHRWEGDIILNAYSGLGESKWKEEGEEWFIDDEKRLETMGFDVLSLKAWYDGKNPKTPSV